MEKALNIFLLIVAGIIAVSIVSNPNTPPLFNSLTSFIAQSLADIRGSYPSYKKKAA